MKTVEIQVPDELFVSFKDTPREFSRRIRMAAAIKLYELGKLSSGRAAELAGIPCVSFLQLLADYGGSLFDFTEEELQQDVNNA